VKKKAGRLPQGYVYLLPTEAQWEYACKAAGKEVDCNEGKKEKFGWFKENARGMVHPVGQKLPNSLGLYDMLGNLSEWCLDSGEDYSNSNNLDPLVFDEPYRIYRGGSFCDRVIECTREGRFFRGEDSRGQKGNGFRVALVPIPVDKNMLYEYMNVGIHPIPKNVTNETSTSSLKDFDAYLERSHLLPKTQR
jgi:formylglycine-generating enzyme required for sulfatase activity